MAKIIDNNLKNEQSNGTLGNNSLNQENPKEKGIINTIGSFLPFAPLLFEQFTGQKLPQATGTIAEIQTNLQQLTTSLQQVLANQNQIFNKITNLETSASQQLISLDRRLQSLRLTHEKKQIEYTARDEEE